MKSTILSVLILFSLLVVALAIGAVWSEIHEINSIMLMVMNLNTAMAELMLEAPMSCGNKINF